MAAFEYKALNAKGKTVKGVIEADNMRQVRQQLREKSLVPVEVSATAEKTKTVNKSLFSFGGHRLSTSELALITRQTATLVKSAMPIETALMAVAEQTEKPKSKSMIMAIRSKVVEGYTLAEGYAEFPSVFDSIFTSMVAAGEKSGHLDAVLERLADYTENRQQMKNQIMQALIYPIMLTLIAFGVIAFLLSTVVPQITEQFVTSGKELPTLTQAMLAISDFIQNQGPFVLLAILALIAGGQQLLRRPTIRFKFDRILLNMPVLGRVIRGQSTSSYARTLSILTSSAVPLLEGMHVAGRVIPNLFMKDKLSEAATKVSEGAALKTSLEQTKLFPPMMLHMIASGEKSGDLEDMLKRAADNQDDLFKTQVNIALQVFQPLMLLIMAGMVSLIVLSILQPIMELNSLVG